MNYAVLNDIGTRGRLFVAGEVVTSDELGDQMIQQYSGGPLIPFPWGPGWHRKRTLPPLPKKPPRYVTAIGAWGDCILALGHIQHARTAFPFATAPGLLFFGKDVHLFKWLLRVGDFDKSLSICIQRKEWANKEIYDSFIEVTCNSLKPSNDLLSLYVTQSGYFIDPGEIFETHIMGASQRDWEPTVPRLNVVYRKFARSLAGNILAFPYSHQCATTEDHHPQTDVVMELLPRPMHVAGLSYSDAVEYKNAIDMRGHTESMAQVFEMAHLATFCVTCSSSLAHYCAAVGINCLVLLRKNDQPPGNLFHRFLAIAGPHIRIAGYRDSVEQILSSVLDWW